jgi:hypothetical protein
MLKRLTSGLIHKGSVIMDNIDIVVVSLAIGYLVWFTWEVWNDFE